MIDYIEFRMPLDVADKHEVYYQIRAIYERRHNLTLAEVQEIFGGRYKDQRLAETFGWTNSSQFKMFSDLSASEPEFVFLANIPTDISKELERYNVVKESEEILNDPIANAIIEIENLQNKLNDVSDHLSKLKESLKEEKEKNK